MQISPSPGGCLFPVDPDVPAWVIPALWAPEFDGTTAILSAVPADLKTRPLPPGLLLSAIVREVTPDGEHFILPHPSGDIRVLVTTGDAYLRPQGEIPFDGDEERRATALLRLIRYVRGRPIRGMPRRFKLSVARIWRYAEALVVHDGIEAGAPRQEIGSILDPSVSTISSAEWDAHPLRQRINRRLTLARLMMSGRYLDLVRQRRR